MLAPLSIITCTRNPRADMLARVLDAVAALRVPVGMEREYVIVDSASAPAVETMPVVKRFLAAASWARVVRVAEPGIARARREAVRVAGGDVLVWFDDDNVPAPDYLERAMTTATANPEVAVWGAGRIVVEFIDPVPAWVDPAMRPLFQERAHHADEYGHATSWAPYFPVGSGMVTRRAAMERWAEGAESGRYSLTGRVGRSLASGEDAQVIFGAVATGRAVGVTATQSLTHLIPAARCSLRYLLRLEFALALSIRVARAECFPQDEAAWRHGDVGLLRSVRAVLSRARRHGWREGLLELARRAGARRGAFLASLSRR